MSPEQNDRSLIPEGGKAKNDVGIRVSEQTEKKMCVKKKLQSEIKKAIGGEKRTKENVSEKKERGKRSRNALQRNK